MTEPIRWTGSDRPLLEASEIEELASDVVAEISEGQYDGYKARNQILAITIAFRLCGLTRTERWRVHADQITDQDSRLFRVWVERQEGDLE